MCGVSQFHLIYDDRCPVCLGAVDRVRKLDRMGLVELMPVSQIPQMRGVPNRRGLLEQVHLITPEGKIYRGADAVGILAGLFPESRYLGRFILLPGIRRIARVVYRFVARHRLKLSRLTTLN